MRRIWSSVASDSGAETCTAWLLFHLRLLLEGEGKKKAKKKTSNHTYLVFFVIQWVGNIIHLEIEIESKAVTQSQARKSSRVPKTSQQTHKQTFHCRQSKQRSAWSCYGRRGRKRENWFAFLRFLSFNIQCQWVASLSAEDALHNWISYLLTKSWKGQSQIQFTPKTTYSSRQSDGRLKMLRSFLNIFW